MLKCMNPDCGKEFLYAAKQIAKPPIAITVMGEKSQKNLIESVESHVCPYCQSLDLREVEETQPQIESIISVKICDADAKLKEGYEVKDTYASSVTLVKKAKQ